MTEMKHTPPPWSFDSSTSSWVWAGGIAVAAIPIDVDGKISEANARLIAAAPDLLDCLIAVRDADVDGLAHIDIEAAIAKATG